MARQMIGPAIPTRCAVIGTSGMIATGGTIIVTRSFSLIPDTIFWTEAIGIRHGVTIHCRATTTTTGRFIPTVTCSQTKSSRTSRSPCKMQVTILGAITGSLNLKRGRLLRTSSATTALPITGAIDEPTVESLGLGQSEVYQSADVPNSSY